MNTMSMSLSQLINLSGKTALITGGAMGIGAAIAHRYAEAGANLILVDRDQAALRATALKLQQHYGVHVGEQLLDLSDTDAITRYWESLDFPPDILVNNAGVFRPYKVEELSHKDYQWMMGVNTEAVLFMCKGMIARRGKAGGTIVNISSIEARSGFTDNMTVYGMSKAAVLALSRGLTKDYTKHGWKINTILPGGVATPGAKKLGIAALKRLDFSIIFTGIKFNSRLPFGKMGTPDDIARAALYLGCPISDYLCGSEVVVDGGFLSV